MRSGEHPYKQFNFALHLSSDGSVTPHGGFHECSGLSAALESASLRVETAEKHHIEKITGINKSTDVTLKRGVVSAVGLNEWLDEIRASGSASRDIMITLQSDPTKPPRRWKLLRARIIKHTSGPLNAKGADVAIEELVLSHEGLEPE